MYRFDRDRYNERMRWYLHDRFGMFIHFGLYAIPARGEWLRSTEEMPEERYLPYFDEFNPKDLDMRAWARSAKRAGMRYAVLTAKHHDGFCLYDTDTTDFKSTNTPYGRDIVADFLEAFRAEASAWASTTRSSTGTTPTFRSTATARRRCAATRWPAPTRGAILAATSTTCTLRCASSASATASSTSCGSTSPTTI